MTHGYIFVETWACVSIVGRGDIFTFGGIVGVVGAHNDISVPILVSTLSVPAVDTPNTVLLILLLTEILAHIHTQIRMNCGLKYLHTCTHKYG